MKKLKIHVIAEKFVGEANGVTTAILELIESLKRDSFYELQDGPKSADVVHAHTIGLGYVRESFKHKKKMIVSAHVVPDSFIGSLIFSELWRSLKGIRLKLFGEHIHLLHFLEELLPFIITFIIKSQS